MRRGVSKGGMAEYPLGSKEGLAEAERRIAACKVERGNVLGLLGLGIEELPASVRELRGLRVLRANGNALTTLPSWIGELTSLEGLHLHDNRLEQLPPEIRHLQNLVTLTLDGGTPEAADAVVVELGNLELLGLQRMGLAHIPSWLRGLRKLRELHLQGNDLRVLPSWLSELPLAQLFLKGNDRLGLPPEITAAYDDPKKILDYYFRIAASDAAQPLNEFKLVLVGRGGVGKTTLVHRLVEDEYREFPETPGIRIAKWPVTIDGEEKRAHVWDFGGQEIMHGTHRFFMTERALYLVLLSRRENLEDRDAEYWLSLVRSFAGDVPVIVLLHKCDSGLIEVNRRLLREKYGESIAFLETDSATGTGIRELKEKICQLAGALPGLQTKWPRAWHQVKEELPGAQKNWMTFEEFCAFCSERGVPERKDQEAMAESLHDLGLMLAYRREEALRGFGVLNPQWVTNGIYAVLNAPALKEAGGRFTVDDLASVLVEAEYPRTLHPYLLALMRKFKLCHPLDDAGTKFLIPELLTKEEPPALDTEFPPAECLGFVYRYDTVLPEGLLSRFIVETYVHRAPRHAWRTGVVLEREGCRALIRGDVLGRRIAILVTGSTSGRRVLLGIVREHFERIHRTFEKLPVTELVPIPGVPGVEADYAELRAYEDAGDDEYKVVIG